MALEPSDSVGMADSGSQDLLLSFGVEAVGTKLGMAFHGSLLPLCATPARAVLQELFCVRNVQHGAGMVRGDGEVPAQPNADETKPRLHPSVPCEGPELSCQAVAAGMLLWEAGSWEGADGAAVAGGRSQALLVQSRECALCLSLSLFPPS